MFMALGESHISRIISISGGLGASPLRRAHGLRLRVRPAQQDAELHGESESGPGLVHPQSLTGGESSRAGREDGTMASLYLTWKNEEEWLG